MTASFTNGGALVGSGSAAIRALAVLADGSIHIGDGVTDPAVLAAFTSATGTLKHESGGIEADISAITTGELLKGSSAGAISILNKGAALEVLRVNAGATDLEYAAVGVANHKLIRKTADETVNNSAVMQNDDHFSFSIGANEVWLVNLYLIMRGTDSGGMDFTWSLPSGGQFVANFIGSQDNQSSGVAVGGVDTALITTEVRLVADAASVDIQAIHIACLIVNSSTGGTAQLQWAQATNIATDTIMHSESFMVAHQL